MPRITGSITFGLEIEAVKLTANAAQVMQTRGFSRHFDGSIRGHHGEELPRTMELGGGSEVVTPVYNVAVDTDNEGKHMRLNYGQALEAVRDLCSIVAEVNTSCGVHIHLGRPGNDGKSLWKPDMIRTFLAICTLKEEIFFGLVPKSRKQNRFCLPIRERFSAPDFTSFYPVGNVLPRKDANPKRYAWLNLIETKRVGHGQPGRMDGPATGTIEIRLLGNTRRVEYIWAWTQLWVKIAACVAYLNSSLAMMHCIVAESLASEIEAVRQSKEEDAPAPANEPDSWENIPNIPTHVVPVIPGSTPRPATPITPRTRTRRVRPTRIQTAPVEAQTQHAQAPMPYQP